MDIVRVPSNDSRMSERRLSTMRAKLGVIRALSAPLADVLEEHVPRLTEDGARTGLALLENLLLSFSDDELEELESLVPQYLDLSEDALADCIRIAAQAQVFRGVERPLIAQTYNFLRPVRGRDEALNEAGLAMNRCLAVICGYSLDLEETRRLDRRGHLRLVHSVP